MEYMSHENGFLGLRENDDKIDLSKAKAVVIPFGMEKSVSYGEGTARGPQAMIDASQEVELFDEYLWCEPIREFGVATMKAPAIKEDAEAALKQLEDITESVLAEGKFPMIFGGEHTITAGSIRPFIKRYPDLAVLHFDAHADLRNEFEGIYYSHAAALRRCFDNPLKTLVSVGIRNISQEEIPFLDENRDRIHIHWGRDKKNWNMEDIIAPLKGRPVYVTFDVDGFDASLMPSTGTPEPGGLLWNEAAEIIEEAAKVSTFVGADVNELAPVDQFHGPDFIAAKLAYKIMSLAFLGKNPGFPMHK